MKVTSIHYLKFKGGKKKSFVPYITLTKNKIATGLGALNMIHSLVIPSVYRQVPRKRKKKNGKSKEGPRTLTQFWKSLVKFSNICRALMKNCFCMISHYLGNTVLSFLLYFFFYILGVGLKFVYFVQTEYFF